MTAKLTLNSTLPLGNTGVNIPRLGFGVYQSHGPTCIKSCHTALKAGYRHIDSAQYYANEAQVGSAVAQYKDLPRTSIFLTTKILSAGKDFDETYSNILDSIKKLNDGAEDSYVDLFLIHSPNAGPEAVKSMWQPLEKAHLEGKIKAIGVSNFGKGQIEGMKSYAKCWPPVVNQIELHPWCQQRTAVSYCVSNNITIQAYCPLVRNQKASDPTLNSIAKKHNTSTGQVLIRYCLQKDWIPLPKSDTPSRIESNADVYGFELDEGDMKELDGLDQADAGAIVQAVKND